MTQKDEIEKNGFIFKLVEGDITLQKTDAIVNAANTQLILGAGVAGAIRRRGGPKIQEECNKLAPIKTGEAVITTGGNLDAKYVIHTAGPIYYNYSKKEADELLRNSVLNSLKFLEREDINSITFPAISAGIYGFPAKRCSEVMINAVNEYMKQNKELSSKKGKKLLIQICLYGQDMFNIFKKTFSEIFK
ncbi:MAG: macro domain-containing protein [Promethearchaeota archaeon]